MKMSDKKAATKRKLIDCAVTLFTEQGYDTTTMKQIAKAGGVGDATIYKYFANKELILLSYFEQCAQDAITQAQGTAEFSEFTLHEKMQLLLDFYIEILMSEREFVLFCVDKFSHSPLFLLQDALKVQLLFREVMFDFLSEAEKSEEIPQVPFKSAVCNLLAEYVFAVVFFWSKDDSEEFTDTSQMIELSLAIIVIVLQSGLINKVTEFGGFMIKAQLFNLMNNKSGLLSLLKNSKSSLAGFGL
ncbi:MAG: TetR family transcriptional regulator [Oceanospirillaceae bacterium]|nr:TetR family transcriptional regulator [Oceanospirillaceae bacterium]